jgi:Uma2 family endonuclease
MVSKERVLLRNISWQTFEGVLADTGKDGASRLTYEQKTMEIIVPNLFHEHWNRLIEFFIFVLAEELSLEILPLGSITLKRQDLQIGVVPDSCYYIYHEGYKKNASELEQGFDLLDNIVPNLVVEIDLDSSSLDKFPIYAAIGVVELWRYSQGILNIYQLLDGEYIQCHNSPLFAQLPLIGIPKFLAESQKLGVMGVVRNFRQWVRIMLGSNTKRERGTGNGEQGNA